MSTRILVAFAIMPVRVAGGADHCSNSCRKKPRGSGVCMIFGPLTLKQKTKHTYFRATACVTAELLALELESSPEEQRGQLKDERRAF